jgi:hypothetical protein
LHALLEMRRSNMPLRKVTFSPLTAAWNSRVKKSCTFFCRKNSLCLLPKRWAHFFFIFFQIFAKGLTTCRAAKTSRSDYFSNIFVCVPFFVLWPWSALRSARCGSLCIERLAVGGTHFFTYRATQWMCYYMAAVAGGATINVQVLVVRRALRKLAKLTRSSTGQQGLVI